MPTDMTVANEIMRQLGGSRFTMMTGAKNILGDAKSLSFHIGKNKTKTNYVKITLKGDDTYAITFSQFSRKYLSLTELKNIDGVHCGELQTVFTGFTGMHTHL